MGLAPGPAPPPPSSRRVSKPLDFVFVLLFSSSSVVRVHRESRTVTVHFHSQLPGASLPTSFWWDFPSPALLPVLPSILHFSPEVVVSPCTEWALIAFSGPWRAQSRVHRAGAEPRAQSGCRELCAQTHVRRAMYTARCRVCAHSFLWAQAGTEPCAQSRYRAVSTDPCAQTCVYRMGAELCAQSGRRAAGAEPVAEPVLTAFSGPWLGHVLLQASGSRPHIHSQTCFLGWHSLTGVQGAHEVGVRGPVSLWVDGAPPGPSPFPATRECRQGPGPPHSPHSPVHFGGRGLYLCPAFSESQGQGKWFLIISCHFLFFSGIGDNAHSSHPVSSERAPERF